MIRARRLAFIAIGCAVVPASIAHAVTINIKAGATLAANVQALAAFERAGDAWESPFSDPVTVNIDALGTGILGSALSVQLQNGYATVRNLLADDAADEASNGIVSALPATSPEFFALLPPGITLQGALAGTKANFKALGVSGLDQLFGATDATITFSTNFLFDFDNSNGVDSNKIDFETVAMHEIGHALGFVSVVDQIDFLVTNNLKGAIAPRLLDLFRFDANGQNPATLPNLRRLQDRSFLAQTRCSTTLMTLTDFPPAKHRVMGGKPVIGRTTT